MQHKDKNRNEISTDSDDGDKNSLCNSDNEFIELRNY